MAVGVPVTFVVHQEDIHICSGVEPHLVHGFRGRVEQMRQRGSGWVVSVRGDNTHIMSIACARLPDLVPGQEVTVTFPPHAVWMLPA